MRAIVTGATGMVGSHLIRALSKKHGKDSVIALTNKFTQERNGPRDRLLRESGVCRVPIDFLEAQPLGSELGDYDVVYHLAANLRTDLRDDETDSPMRINDLGTSRLIERLGDSLRGKLLIYTSSVAAVDRQTADGAPMNEQSPCVPRTLYGKTKLAGEELIIEAAKRLGFRYAIFRLGTVYGTNCREGHIFDRFTQWVRRGDLQGRILWPGKISLIYVDDVVDVLCAAIDMPALQNEIFFLAHDEEITVGEWAGVMAEAMGLKRSFISIPEIFATPLRWLFYQFWFWKRMPQSFALAAWRLSLIMSDGLYCDNSKLKRAYPKEYIDARNGVRKAYRMSEEEKVESPA